MTNTTFIFIPISIPFTRWDLQSIPFQLFTFQQFSFSFSPLLSTSRPDWNTKWKLLQLRMFAQNTEKSPSFPPSLPFPWKQLSGVRYFLSIPPLFWTIATKQSVAPTSPFRTTTRTLSPRKPETPLVQQFNIGLSTYQMRGKLTYRPSIRIVHSTITKEGRQRRNIVELKGSQPSPSNNNTNTNIFRFA